MLAATTESAISFGGPTLTPAGVGLCLVRFSQSGSHQWSQLFDGNWSGGSGIYAVLDVDVSPVDDRIALVGESQGTSDVAGGPLTSAGSSDVLVAVYDGTGAHLWSNALGCSGYQSNLDAGVGPDGALFVSGSAANGVDLGGGPLTYGGLGHAEFEGAASAPTAAPTTLRPVLMHAAAPNPFNPSTTIRLSVTRSGPFALEIFDPRGRRIRTLHRGSLESGDHDFVWQGRTDDGDVVASGVYFARLATRGEIQMQKLVLVK